jgi:site-specific recombinase XerD
MAIASQCQSASTPEPDWTAAVRAVLDNVANKTTRAMYSNAIGAFFRWVTSHGNPPVTESTCRSHLAYLQSEGYAPATLNQRLSAIRKLVGEAANLNLLPLVQCVMICRIRNIRETAISPPTSLSQKKTEALINVPDGTTNKGKRDKLLLALLIGCALRRGEVVNLKVEDIEYVDSGVALIRITSSNGRLRSVLMPDWVEEALSEWVLAAGIKEGPILRAVSRKGEVATDRLSPQTVLNLVRELGEQIGVTVHPEDLRRTCAKLCRPGSEDLEPIRGLLGHSSLATTARYFRDRHDLVTVSSRRVNLRWRKAS